MEAILNGGRDEEALKKHIRVKFFLHDCWVRTAVREALQAAGGFLQGRERAFLQ